MEEAAASSLEPKKSTLDLNFITILSNDPRRALSYARNIDEVNKAKSAIAELEKVSPITNKPIQTIPRINAEYRQLPKKSNQILNYMYLPPYLQAKAEAARPTIDLATSAEDELPDLDAPPVARIPAPDRQKTTGFAPSSAKRGRGSRGGRGSTTRGRGGPATRAARGGNTKKRGTTRKNRSSEVFDATKNPEAAEVVEDMPEIDKDLPRYEQLRQIVAHKQAGGAPEGHVEQLNQNIKDNEGRVLSLIHI